MSKQNYFIDDYTTCETISDESLKLEDIGLCCPFYSNLIEILSINAMNNIIYYFLMILNDKNLKFNYKNM